MAGDYIEYGSDKIATHSFPEGGETKHTERICPGAGVYPDPPDDTAVATTTGLVANFFAVTTGKGRIVVSGKAETTAGATFSIQLVYYKTETQSAANIIGVSSTVILTMSSLLDGGDPSLRLAGVAVFANDVGARSVGVNLVTITPNNSVSLEIAAF